MGRDDYHRRLRAAEIDCMIYDTDRHRAQEQLIKLANEQYMKDISMSEMPVDAMVSDDDDSYSLLDAIDTVGDSVTNMWEVYGGDASSTAVMEVDGQLVEVTVSVKLV